MSGNRGGVPVLRGAQQLQLCCCQYVSIIYSLKLYCFRLVPLIYDVMMWALNMQDLLIFQYSEQKAPKPLLTDSAIVSPRLYLHKNRERHFLILKECTGNFCANNVNQMHKENFIINYRRHSSLNAEVALQLSWRFATKL